MTIITWTLGVILVISNLLLMLLVLLHRGRGGGLSDLFGGGFRLDNNLGNAKLEPEIKTEWEIGSDLRFLNDDLTFSFTYYQFVPLER